MFDHTEKYFQYRITEDKYIRNRILPARLMKPFDFVQG